MLLLFWLFLLFVVLVVVDDAICYIVVYLSFLFEFVHICAHCTFAHCTFTPLMPLSSGETGVKPDFILFSLREDFFIRTLKLRTFIGSLIYWSLRAKV